MIKERHGKTQGELRKTSYFFALIGPFGAYAAILVFRHKTRKLKFYLVPVYAILNGTILLWFLIPSMK
jgi:uncharacterized membrane protein YsdA (DUF1294 family)